MSHTEYTWSCFFFLAKVCHLPQPLPYPLLPPPKHLQIFIQNWISSSSHSILMAIISGQWNALPSYRRSAFRSLVGLSASLNYECGLGLCKIQKKFNYMLPLASPNTKCGLGQSPFLVKLRLYSSPSNGHALAYSLIRSQARLLWWWTGSCWGRRSTRGRAA